MKIVADSAIPFLQGVLEPWAEVRYLPGSRIAAEDVRDADALIIRTRTRCDGRLLAGSRVRLIATATIGFDHIDTAWCAAHGIRVATAAGCNARGVLQWAGAVLAHLARTQGWKPAQRTLGIVGVGHVGSLIREYAGLWGFRVVCCDPPREEREHCGFLPLEEVAREADLLTFHTPLDTTTRQLTVSDTCQALLSDTVGFIAKLPHHLVEAFRATLEELEYADLLVLVIDSADPEREDHIAVVNRLIAELAKPGTPVLECYNKCDLVPDDEIPRGSDKVAISAASGYGLDTLRQAIETQLGRGKHHVKLLLPYQQGSMVAALHDTAQVLSSEYADNGIQIDAVLDETLFGKLRQYVIEEV